MGGRKVTIVFEDDVLEQFERRAKQSGIGRASTLIRHLAVKAIAQETNADKDACVVEVPVSNYREIAGYVEQKKLWSVAAFAVQAMAMEMRKHPLTAAQKERAEKSID